MSTQDTMSTMEKELEGQPLRHRARREGKPTT